MKLFHLIAVWSLFISSSALALLPGDLDTTFGQDKNGVVIIGPINDVNTNDVNTKTQASALITVNDSTYLIGQIIGCTPKAGGGCTDYRKLVIIKLKNDGTPDTTFGTQGTSIYDPSLVNMFYGIYGILDSHGKIVLVSKTLDWSGSDFSSSLIVIRLNLDGTLDPSFGSNGQFIFPTAFNAFSPATLSEDTSHRLVIGGQNNVSPGKSTLTRLNENGTLDQSFGNNGNVAIDLSLSGQGNGIKKLFINSDDSILAIVNSGNDPIVAKFKSNGSIDLTFGKNGNGIVTYPTLDSSIFKWISDATQDKSGNIFMGGGTYVTHTNPKKGNTLDFLLMKIKSADGALDATFGTKGIVTTHFGSTYTDNSAGVSLLDKSGKLTVAGGTGPANWDPIKAGTQIAIAQYDPYGSLDGLFGNFGIVTTAPGYSSFPQLGTIDGSGNILVAGYHLDQKDSPANIFLARYISAVCGDSSVDGQEQCDDGNVKDGDGCSSKCLTETPGTTPVASDTDGSSTSSPNPTDVTSGPTDAVSGTDSGTTTSASGSSNASIPSAGGCTLVR